MTSLKGPSSEHGDLSPDLDVLTGPPAVPPAAAEGVAEASEPELGPPEEPPFEPAPVADTADAEPTPSAEPAIEVAELGALPAETPVVADDVAVEPAIVEEPPVEEPAPEVAVDAPASDHDIGARSVSAEPVEPPVVDDAGIAEIGPAAEPATHAALGSTPEPAAELPPPLPEPTAVPPLPEIPEPPALEIAAPLVAPAIASTIAPPTIGAREAPTQPAPAQPIHAPPPISTTVTQPPRARRRVWLRRALLAFVGAAFGYAALVLILIVVYRTVDPPRSTVMLGVSLSGVSVDYEPVPISSISTYLLRAVVTSEDARFCRHGGVDWGALAEAMQDSRGGSTITMQVAKNLFLWPSRSYIRKAIEIPVALLIDFAWPKRRILEIYLNIAEWGPGIFGAEAAAQYHFGKPASRLTQHEATLLAASLPNPIAREAGDPGRVTALLASRLRARMANSDAYVGCLGLRPMPRAEPEPRQRTAPAGAAQSPPKSAPKTQQWQSKTEPAKPPTPFNPWQN
jgi:monofunctional biosynthetic peptidoglycan transglycosylase